ncbi:MAG: hypothetical protein OHK0046_13900 [Anaerolineae bacterium]
METQDDTWIEDAKARGLDGVLRVCLDALAPFGVLGAQVLWLLQPVSGLIGWHRALGALAHALEDPEAWADLRARLDEPESSDQ